MTPAADTQTREKTSVFTIQLMPAEVEKDAQTREETSMFKIQLMPAEVEKLARMYDSSSLNKGSDRSDKVKASVFLMSAIIDMLYRT
jgi:hypothetical protein